MKKLISILISIILVFIISGCFSRTGLLSREIASEEELTSNMIEKIIEALENKDSKALKNLFSENAKINSNNLEEGVEYLLQLYEGNSVSLENHLGGTSESIEYGKVYKRINSHYVVNTDKETYDFYFIVEYSNFDDNKNGLFQLIVTKASETRSYYWMRHDETTGILWKDILIPEDYIAGLMRAFNNSDDGEIFNMFSKEVQSKVSSLLFQIGNTRKKVTGYMEAETYENFPVATIISNETVGTQTIIEATCEVPTTKNAVPYLLYIKYIKDSANKDKDGIVSIQVFDKVNINSEIIINKNFGAFYNKI